MSKMMTLPEINYSKFGGASQYVMANEANLEKMQLANNQAELGFLTCTQDKVLECFFVPDIPLIADVAHDVPLFTNSELPIFEPLPVSKSASAHHDVIETTRQEEMQSVSLEISVPLVIAMAKRQGITLTKLKTLASGDQVLTIDNLLETNQRQFEFARKMR